jgi:hypothetical protein
MRKEWGQARKLSSGLWAKLIMRNDGTIEVILGESEDSIREGAHKSHIHFIKEPNGTWYYNPRGDGEKMNIIRYSNYPDADEKFEKLKTYMRVSNWQTFTDYDIVGYLEMLVRELSKKN